MIIIRLLKCCLSLLVCSKNLANSRLGTGSLRTGCVCSRAAHTEGQVSGHTCTYDPSRCVRPSIPKSTSLSDSSNACFLHFDNIPSWLEKVCFWQHGSLPFHEGERRVSCLPSYLLWEGDLLFDKFSQISCFFFFFKGSPSFGTKRLYYYCIISAVYCYSYIFYTNCYITFYR